MKARKIHINLLVILGTILILSSIISADSICGNYGTAQHVLSTTLIANDSRYAAPGAFLFPQNQMNTLQVIPQEGIQNLTNPFNLASGRYVIQITNGAFSRWSEDSQDTSAWGGGPGLTWEATINAAYNDSGIMKNIKFGDVWKPTSGAVITGERYLINNSGGNVYIYIDDSPITDNRGSETIDVYKCVQNLDFIPNNANCYWAPDAKNVADLQNIVDTRGDLYIGFGYNNQLANITFLGNSTDSRNNYVDERILCYNNQWHVTLNKWPYFNFDANARPWGIIVEPLGKVISDWKNVVDNLWGQKWAKNIVPPAKIDLSISSGVLEPSSVYDNQTFNIKFSTHNTKNTALNVPVEIKVDGVKYPLNSLTFESGDGLGKLSNLGPLTAGQHNLVITIDNTNQYDESNENNNQFVFAFNIKNSTIPPTQKINLIAKSIEISSIKLSENSINFNYNINNTKGNTSAIVNISIDGNNIKSESVNILSGTNKYSSSISNSYSIGNHVIQIFVDSNNLIDESNESDNKVSTTFKIINDNNGGGNNGGDNDNNNNNDRENIFISSPASQWQCTQWSECSDGVQTRTCTDLNDGYNTIGKPEESRICSNDNVQTISQILEKKTNNNWIYWLIGAAIVLVIILLILIFAMMS